MWFWFGCGEEVVKLLKMYFFNSAYLPVFLVDKSIVFYYLYLIFVVFSLLSIIYDNIDLTKIIWERTTKYD